MDLADQTAAERRKKLHSIKEGDGFEPDPIEHREILDRLLNEVEPAGNFKELAKQYGYHIPDGEDARKVYKREMVVLTVLHTLKTAERKDWGLAQRNDSVYLYNGAYWNRTEESDVRYFLGEVAKKIGVDGLSAKYHNFKDDLLKQFYSDAYLPAPQNDDNLILINLKNGTAEIDPYSKKVINLRNPRRKDFLTYQLAFKYNRDATAPRFNQYLEDVLPDKKLQKNTGRVYRVRVY